jgi:hypothetical protein
MGLSCSCGGWDGDGWYYIVKTKLLSETPFYRDRKAVFDQEFFFPLGTKRGRKCKSCGSMIKVGENCIEFERYISTEGDEIKERIHGDEMQIASWFHCERCGEQYLNLEELGYCVDITENMFDLLAEYREEHGIKLVA